MPTPEPAESFVEVTTESRRKRHWSLRRDMHRSRYQIHMPGLSGYTLCGGYRSMNQARLDHELSLWKGRPVTITDLPPCKQCDRSRQRRIDGRGH